MIMLKIQKAVELRKICENSKGCKSCRIKKDCEKLKDCWFDLTCYSIKEIAKQLQKMSKTKDKARI